MPCRPVIHGYLEGVWRFLKLKVVEEGEFGGLGRGELELGLCIFYLCTLGQITAGVSELMLPYHPKGVVASLNVIFDVWR